MARLNKQLITILAAYCLKAVLCHGLWCSSVLKNLVSTSESWKSIQNPSSSRSWSILWPDLWLIYLHSIQSVSWKLYMFTTPSRDSMIARWMCCLVATWPTRTQKDTKGMKVPNWTLRWTSARAHATQLALTHLSRHHWCRLPLDVCCSSCWPLLSILKPVNLHQRGQGWVPVMGIRVSCWSLLQFVHFGR